MVERTVLPAAGLARVLGMLALLAGVVAMHSAVFGLPGHTAGAYTALAPTSVAAPGGPTVAASAAGHASGSPHRHATLPPTGNAAIDHKPLPPHTDDAATAHDPLPPRNPPSATHNATTAHNALPPHGPQAPAGTAATARDPLPPQARAHRDNQEVSGAPMATSGDSSPQAVWATVTAKISPCADGGCDGAHSALHGCVFILVASIASAALVLLLRLAVDRPGGGAARPRHWRARRERPPPWTVLTLAELAILRI
ncbi:hypothetical protein ACWEQA_32845 [Nocardia sp. NPDC004085]